jgi:intracellular multiplication protein IcmV
MKNQAKQSRTMRVISRIINVRYWSDWDRVRSITKYLFNGIKKFFIPQEKEASETFIEAKHRLNLSDSELLAKQKALYRLSILMVAVAALLLIYFGYQLFMVNILAALLSLVMVGVALALAFRYHFWYYQIKEKKLGCSMYEWFKYGLKGEKR